MIEIEVANRQNCVAVPTRRLRAAVSKLLREEGHSRAEISLAIVDDAVIRDLNRRHLKHNWPTDVLSFPLEDGPGKLVGEVVVNGQRAADVAGQFGWKPADELLLYVVHGVLHLCGYDDHSESASRRMRIREKEVLARWGVKEKGTGRK